MRRIFTGLIAAIITVAAHVEARALVFPLGPGDSVSISGMFLCAKSLPCEGSRLYEFTVTQPSVFEAPVTLSNFTDVTFRLFPAAAPGAPLDEWSASSPGASTLVTLSYAALLPDIVYNFTIGGFVPRSAGTVVMGGFEGSFGVTSAPVSAVPLPGAIWFFGSGLVLLLGFARRRRGVQS